MVDSSAYDWQRRPGVFLAVRYLRHHTLRVHETPLSELPRLSPAAIRLALRLFPHFLERADLDFPIIVAGKDWYQVALDGRHRLSKAIWTGRTHLPTVRVPWRFALELLIPGPYLAEWLYLALLGELRKVGGHRHRHPAAPSPPAESPPRSED